MKNENVACILHVTRLFYAGRFINEVDTCMASLCLPFKRSAAKITKSKMSTFTVVYLYIILCKIIMFNLYVEFYKLEKNLCTFIQELHFDDNSQVHCLRTSFGCRFIH